MLLEGKEASRLTPAAGFPLARAEERAVWDSAPPCRRNCCRLRLVLPFMSPARHAAEPICDGKALGSKVALSHFPRPRRVCTKPAAGGMRPERGLLQRGRKWGSPLAAAQPSSRPTAPPVKATQLASCHQSSAGAGAAFAQKGTRQVGTMDDRIRAPCAHRCGIPAARWRPAAATTVRHCNTATMFTERLRKLPFWNNNTSQDKESVLVLCATG